MSKYSEFIKTVVIREEDGLYIAKCPELDMDASGITMEKAFSNLFGVIHASMEILNEDGDLEQYLENKGWVFVKEETWYHKGKMDKETTLGTKLVDHIKKAGKLK